MPREYFQKNIYDDAASIVSSQAETLVNKKANEIRSATNHKQGPYEPAPLVTMGGTFAMTAVQHLPFSFTDDTIIHVVVVLSSTLLQCRAHNRAQKPQSNFMSRLQTGMSASSKACSFKVIKMPRREYLKYIAKDKQGNYIGTEEKREWTEEMLEDMFGVYQGLPPTQWAANVAGGIA